MEDKKQYQADIRELHEKKRKYLHIIEGVTAVIFIICIFAGTILPYFSYTKDGPTKIYSIKISSRSTVDYLFNAHCVCFATMYSYAFIMDGFPKSSA